MMEVDISGIWGELSLPDLLGLEKEVFYAHRAVAAAPEDFGLTQAQLEADFRLYSYENPAWLYVAARKLLFGLGRTREQMEFCGPDAQMLAEGCDFLPVGPAEEDSFLTLICRELPAEELVPMGQPVITLIADTPEQLRLFFRFSAALWEKLD